MGPNLKGKICIVTGASRGIGRGIALQLGSAGAKVYITGRNDTSLNQVATEIRSRGGDCIPVQLDHSSDKEVHEFFKRVETEEKGKLDLLVNNAFSAVSNLLETFGKPFWSTDPVKDWDSVNNVGLRNHYLCTVYASRIMVKAKQGLIVNISSYGGWNFFFNVAYTVGKSACDRMAVDAAIQLQKENVCMVSLWPGSVKTETVKEVFGDEWFQKAGETPEFCGLAVAHLAADQNYLSKSGKILLTCELAKEYGFTDLDGSIPDGLVRKREKSWFASAFNHQ